MRTLILIFLMLSVNVPGHAEEPLNLEEHLGKVVVLDFWASWCVPCRRSFPWMNDMQNKYGEDGLVIIAVNVDRDAELAARFLNEYPANFSVVYDPTARLAKQYKVEVMPSSLVIGRDGKLLERHAGFKVNEQPEYEDILRAALEAQP